MTEPKYEPKEGRGWVEGDSVFAAVRRWRYQLDLAGELWLQCTVAAKGTFTISRVLGMAHTVPDFEDMKRIELDYGVRAWSIEGCFKPLGEARGAVLICRAVGAR